MSGRQVIGRHVQVNGARFRACTSGQQGHERRLPPAHLSHVIYGRLNWTTRDDPTPDSMVDLFQSLTTQAVGDWKEHVKVRSSLRRSQSLNDGPIATHSPLCSSSCASCSSERPRKRSYRQHHRLPSQCRQRLMADQPLLEPLTYLEALVRDPDPSQLQQWPYRRSRRGQVCSRAGDRNSGEGFAPKI